MVNTKLNLSMTEPYVRQIYAKEGDTGRVLEIGLEDYPTENGTLRILRPDGVEKTSDALSTVSPTITDGMATFDSLEEAEVTELKIALSPKQDLHGYANPWVGGGGTNLVEFPDVNTTQSNVTIKAENGIMSISTNGTASANVLPYSVSDITHYDTMAFGPYPAGTYTATCLNFVPSVTNDRVISQARYSDNTTVDGGDSKRLSPSTIGGSNNIVTFTATAPFKFDFYVHVQSGSSMNSSDIKVILNSGQTIATWSPYSNICPIYPSNGKNLLNNTASSSSPSGITFTVNADGTVTATGTATADAQLQIPFSGLSGNYYFCGCPSGGNASTKYDVYAWDTTVSPGGRFKKWNGTTVSASDVGTYSLQEIQIPSGHIGFIVIRIKSGYAIQGSLLFKPMIVASTETSNIYVPYQGINVYQSGKNLIPRIFSDGKVPSISTGALVNSSNACRSDYISVEGGSVTLSCDNTNNRQIYLFLYDSNMTFLTYQSTSGNFVTVTDANAQYAMVRCDGGTTSPSNIQLELGSSATPYEPYNGTTYPIPLGRDVYGGTLDVVSGKLVVDKAIVDLGNKTWTYYTSASIPIFYADFADGKPHRTAGLDANAICSNYPVYPTSINASTMASLGYFKSAIASVAQNYMRFFVTDSRYTSASDFKTAMNGVQLCYELATPQTYQLTAQQISTLLGENNVWSDGEITELTFDYGKLLSVLTADQTAVVGRCLGDVNFTNVSTMPFTLNVIPNNQEETP